MQSQTKKLGIKAAAYRAEGMGWKEIGEKLNCSLQLARYRALQAKEGAAGLSAKEKKLEREKHIRTLKEEGKSQKAIALEVGCSQGLVSQLLKHDRGAPKKALSPAQIQALEKAKNDGFKRGKRAFTLHYEDGFEWAEVGEVMGASSNAVQCLSRRFKLRTGRKTPTRLRHYSLDSAAGRKRVGMLFRRDVDKQKKAFELRECGTPWKDVATALNTSIPGATAMARSYDVEKRQIIQEFRLRFADRE